MTPALSTPAVFLIEALWRLGPCPAPTRCPYCPAHTPPHWICWGRYERYAGDPEEPARKVALYAVQDVLDNAPSTDNKWFHYYIRVEDKHVIIQIDGKTTMAWTQPEDWTPPQGMEGRKIGEGTFALQGHDPKSLVYYKNIEVRVPPQPMDKF